MNAKITGIASYVPDYVLTNDELSHMVDTNDEWITTRVGIKERRILKGEGTGSSDLGEKAVAELLRKTGVKPEEVDLLICATSNPDYRFPSTASIVLETSVVGQIRGLQIRGSMRRPKGERLRSARKAYLKRFPFAVFMDVDVWVIEPDYFKYTDNRLGFGKKIVWEKERNGHEAE